ncbi:unnamed protein product [Rotaria sp. Silwood2]|nr:unnamed protein product [Rotaria sp. Silwood2]
MTFDCLGQSVCDNDGQCFQDKPDCPQRTMCIYPACFFGTRCQFRRNEFGLSLNAILGYHILPHISIIYKSKIVKISFALTIIFITAGFTNGVLALITFKNKNICEVGCGLYLLGSSITTLLVTIFFGLKFWIFLLAQMTYIYRIDFILRICLNMDQWLNACVATERAVTIIKATYFNKPKISDIEAFALLIQARDAFDARFELPDTSGLSLTNISRENWSIPASTLIQVPKESDEFRRVAADFDGGASSIVRIDRIENAVWLMQYLNQKQIVDARLGHDDTEKLLFHGCPYAAAEQILQQAFDHSRIGRNGTYFGYGFYFSTSRQVSDRYAVPNPSTGEKRILMCRVLVGRSCEGNSTMRTCPSNYDSTTGGSNIYVVYSNRHILPEYLITYK